MPAARPLLLAVLIAAALPATAAAGTVTARDVSSGGPDPFQEHEIAWTAAAGEANQLTVIREGGHVTLTDAGAPLTAGTGCEQVAGGSARCAVPTTRTAVLLAAAGDGDDAITATGVGARIDAGPGDDRVRAGGKLFGGDGADALTGGDFNDELHGGAGADALEGAGGRDQLYGDRFDAQTADDDRLDGGEDLDTVVYRGRIAPLDVDLAAGRGGQAGEIDALVAIESVEGGSGADRIAGTGGPDDLHGGEGDDTVTGLGGDDFLFGDEGADRLDGGDGRDLLTAGGTGDVRGVRGDHLVGGAGDDRLRTLGTAECGSGIDRLDFFPARRVAPAACEHVELGLGWITSRPTTITRRSVVFAVRTYAGDDPTDVRRAVLRSGRAVLARSRTRTLPGGNGVTRWHFELTRAGRRAMRDGVHRMTLRSDGADRLTTVVRRFGG